MSIASDIRRDAAARVNKHLDGVASTILDAVKAEEQEDRAGIFARLRGAFCLVCGAPRGKASAATCDCDEGGHGG